MASGNYSSNTGVNCNLRVVFSSSTNTADNTSQVTMTAYIDYYAPLYMGSRVLTFNCDGQTYSISTPRISDGGSAQRHTVLGSWVAVVGHNSDGSKRCYVGISSNLNITYSGRHLGNVSAGGTANLDDIPRKSTINEIGNFNVEGEHWLTFSKNSSSFWQSLYIQAKKPGSSNQPETVGVFAGYSSGQHIKFDPGDIAKIYKIAMPDTNIGSYLEFTYHLETYTYIGGSYIGEDSRTVRGYVRGTMFTKVGNSWEPCVPYIKVNGNWKPCVSYVNVNRNWKISKT